MQERPIIFSGPMVRAILEGRKTQTRRVVRDPQRMFGGIHPAVQQVTHRGEGWFGFEASEAQRHYYICTYTLHTVRCPYGRNGDRLWVRETAIYQLCDVAHFAADGYERTDAESWTPSIFMPRWASRILLEITGVRVERLQEISDQDAIAEGIIGEWFDVRRDVSSIASYRRLWESINGVGSWEKNPWVWVVEFRRI